MEKFEWDDDLVIEFTRESTKGQYGIFQGIPKLDGKLKKFKEIKSVSSKTHENNVILILNFK